MSAFRTLLAFLACTSAGFAAEVHFLPGGPAGTQLNGSTSSKGELVSLTDKDLTWRDENNNLILEPLRLVLSIDLQPAAALPNGLRYTDVELTDGSLLHCSRFALKGKEVDLTLAVSEQVVKVPLATIAYVLNDAHDPAIRQEWHEKHLAKKRNQDGLAIKFNDVINVLEGTLGEGNEKGQIVFEFERRGARDKRELDPAKVQGLIFLRSANLEAAPSACQVHDVNQDVLVASKVFADGKRFTITTVSGARFELPRQTVARLDYRGDKLIYLSDLKPAQIIEKTRQGRKDNWRTDKNLENSSLKLEGQVYAKGLALHAHTELVYMLDGKYKEFKAIVGMDDMVGGDGRPVVKIEGDGKELFAATVGRKDNRRELALEVKGVKQLRIIVTSAGLFDFGDHVDFADARLCK